MENKDFKELNIVKIPTISVDFLQYANGFLKCNPMLVLGGLLMPLSLTLGLVLGGLCSLLLPKEKIDLEPLCSGIFAANSLCMIVQALL